MKRWAGWWENELKVDAREAIDTRKVVDIYIHLYYPSSSGSLPNCVMKSLLLCSNHYMRLYNIGGGIIAMLV